MSIKPIDFQVMLPKTSEVSKIHNDEQYKNQMVQQQQTSVVQQNSENHLRQVYSQNKAQEAKIKEKQEKGQQEKKQEKKKNKTNYGSKKVNKAEEQTSFIDVRL